MEALLSLRRLLFKAEKEIWHIISSRRKGNNYDNINLANNYNLPNSTFFDIPKLL